MSNTEIIQIFALNDVYELDNLARFSKFMADTVERDKPRKHFVTMAGDFLAPSTLSSVDKGTSMVNILNEIGFTHISLGNHEFDLSLEVLLNRIPEIKCPVLTSNIRSKFNNRNLLTGTVDHDLTTVPLFDGQKEFKLGWLGFCTHKTKQLSINVLDEISIKPIDNLIEQKIQEMKQTHDPHFIVTMTHQDVAVDRECVKISSTNLVLGGHDHVPYIEQAPNKEGKPTWLVKVGQEAEFCGVITITIDESLAVLSVDVKTVPLTDPSLPFDPKIEDLIQKSKKSLAFTQNLVIYPNAISAKGVNSKRVPYYTHILTRLRNISSINVDAVFLHAGACRGKDYPNGVTMLEFLNELKFAQFTEIKGIPGSVLIDMVKESRSIPSGKGKPFFLQSDEGVIINEETKELTHIGKKGEPVDPAQEYTVMLPVQICVDRGDDNRKYLLKTLVDFVAQNPKRLTYREAHQPPCITQTFLSNVMAGDAVFLKKVFLQCSFDMIDQNGDGVLTKQEVLDIVGSHELAESLFKVADVNKDGVICLSEWQKLGLSRTKTQILKRKKLEEFFKKSVDSNEDID